MLITSRETKRWVLPKGNPIEGMANHEAAAEEAFEEAGLRGKINATACGQYAYGKRLGNGAVEQADVTVFPLAVDVQAEDWPERAERETAWFTVDAAASAVEETDLADLIRAFGREARKVA